ncbi:hypothetical protein [Haliscomenobacter hydrossis]|uniref:YD repeat-containing protein n=1 Tax=Haliscomenobacter hydrossis (strain ATCC 27775 / DSM 1100 / LMG 10767 / O) TaxID=760192 RepID=F4L5Y5_HALH1|nr:hypothetical protein [Haliscomenobacter hydrossis]AEE53045.1 hypothetical protein Halhy_5219 [Haliscomenobacter hydrossis DSM 1100]
MKSLLSALIILTSTICIAAQNLKFAIHLNDPELFRGEKLVAEMVETCTSALDKEVAKAKTISRYDATQKLILKEQYRADKLVSRDTFTYFSPGGLKKMRISETWSETGEYQRKTQNYVYNDRDFLVRIRDFDAKGYLTHESRLKNNGKMLPYLLDKFDNQDNLQGATEEADFLFDENRYVVKKINPLGKVFSRDTFVLDIRQSALYPGKGEVYNEQGEVAQTIAGNSKYTFEYRYDEQGNWVEKKRFQVLKSNEKEKKTLLEKWERKLIYTEKR